MEALPSLSNTSLIRRLFSLVYEGLLLTALIFIAAYLLLVLLGTAESGWRRIVFQCYLFTVGAVYFTWLWSEGRRTLAMKTWHLAVVTVRGEPLSIHQALLRYILCWLSPVLGLTAYWFLGRWGLLLAGANFFWAWIDRDRQFLHDRLAKTRVVFINPSRRSQPIAADAAPPKH